jgi:hypothetical protein
MPIRTLESEGPVARRILLGAGLGCLFGLQACRLAIYLSNNSLPRFGLAWILASQGVLGIATAGTTGLARWWKRGIPLGLLFATPGATLAHAVGWLWAGAAELVAGAVAGLLIALLVDVVLPKMRPAIRAVDGGASRDEAPAADIRRRLSEGQAALERLDAERQRRGDPRLGKTAEDRIVWGELLELELQDIDERVSRKGNAEDTTNPDGPR